MIEISGDIYRSVAERLRENIGEACCFNGVVEYETEEFYSSLTLTSIVYRRIESLPEGPVSRIVDMVPVWWEFTTVQEFGEVRNDFSFAELKTYITEYQ